MDKPRVAVIGSGFGGLAAAIRLQAAGCDTVIFEKRDQPGGRAYVYRDNGFVFDAGPTVITAPHCLEELFTVAGKSMQDYVELIPVKPFYRLFWDDGYQFDYSDDDDALEKQIRAKSPGDWARLSKISKIFPRGVSPGLREARPCAVLKSVEYGGGGAAVDPARSLSFRLQRGRQTYSRSASAPAV